MPPRYRCPRSLGTDDGRDYPGLMPSASRTAALTATLAFSLGGLAGCGSEESAAQDPAGTTSASPAPGSGESGSATPTPSPSPTPSPTPRPPAPTLPACSEVWVAGATVPGRYQGCLEGQETVPADGRYCEFGKALFTYGRDLWAVAGGPVNVTERPLLRDPGYRRALEQCGG